MSVNKCECGNNKMSRSERCIECFRKPSADRICPECGEAKHSRSKICGKCFDAQRGKSSAQPDETADVRLQREIAAMRSDNARLRNAVRDANEAKGVEAELLGTFTRALEKHPYQTVFHPPQNSSGGGKHEMVLVVSDAHYPEVVDPEACFGIGYGPDICRERMQTLRDSTLSYYQLRTQAYPVDKLTIAVLGDMLSGNIHDELEVTNADPMCEALVNMAYMLHEFGKDMAETFPEVEMVIMPGNHPRMTKKPRHKNKWDNFEWLMGKMIEALATNQFKVTVPKDIVYRHQVFDKVIGMTHGDGVKISSFAGIPHYSLQRRRNALQNMLREVNQNQVDLLIYGHFHQLIYDQAAGFLINGSIKGPDEFSINTRYSAVAPVQALLTFHKKHGLTDISHIKLG